MEHVIVDEKEKAFEKWLLQGVDSTRQLRKRVQLYLPKTRDPQRRKTMKRLIHDERYADLLLANNGFDKMPANSLVGETFGFI